MVSASLRMETLTSARVFEELPCPWLCPVSLGLSNPLIGKRLLLERGQVASWPPGVWEKISESKCSSFRPSQSPLSNVSVPRFYDDLLPPIPKPFWDSGHKYVSAVSNFSLFCSPKSVSTCLCVIQLPIVYFLSHSLCSCGFRLFLLLFQSLCCHFSGNSEGAEVSTSV